MIKVLTKDMKKEVNEIVEIHLKSFKGFFLSFLGRGFLKCLYENYIFHSSSGILIFVENDVILGFLAYSKDLSSFYSTLLTNYFFKLMWYSLVAFLKRPVILFRLFRALLYPKQSKRIDKYIDLSSIGVIPEFSEKGIGTLLVTRLKKISTLEIKNGYKYIRLSTDAENNEKVNQFYLKNHFVLNRVYFTKENRKMNEYRFYLED